MDQKTVRIRWACMFVLTAICFAVLGSLDHMLKKESGSGTIDLQRVWTAAAAQEVIAKWHSERHAAWAGFCLGFDYLMMPLYAFTFYYAGLAARHSFAPRWRRAITVAAFVPFVGAALDACENALELTMVLGGPTDPLALAAFSATVGKWACVFVGIGLTLLAVAGLFKRGVSGIS